ncbi:hypothetical protein LOTGIDRAFT_238704 [Lottia gigantea]|uniref:Uncharacterized protein n=1 Tax=Lottia gigantea TaxID=225164 RepID=V4B0Q6_LOTGI|nr:hypothetical protein LOTGIDRAFT_238704 [Lottia gigantea]ESO99801.1 hypothetical protein LOTGIDRAFT_238704 [Lottia gigantea]
MMFILAFFAALGMVVNGQIDVTGCATFTAELGQCKTNHQVTGSETLVIDNYLKFYTTSTSVICADNFSAQLECAITAYINCGNEISIEVVAEPATYKRSLKEVCDSKEDYKADCISVSFDTCVKANLDTPGANTTAEDSKKYYCTLFDQAINCTDTDAGVSGCEKPNTKTILKDVLTDLKPQACGTTTIILTTSLLVFSLVFSLFF